MARSALCPETTLRCVRYAQDGVVSWSIEERLIEPDEEKTLSDRSMTIPVIADLFGLDRQKRLAQMLDELEDGDIYMKMRWNAAS